MSQEILLNQLLSNTQEIQGFLIEATARLESMIVYTGRTQELSEVQSVLQKIENLVQDVTEDLSITIDKKMEKPVYESVKRKIEKIKPKTVEGYLEYAQSILKEALVLVQSVEGNLDMTPIRAIK